MSQYGIKEVMDFVLTDYHPEPYKRKPLLYVDYAQITDIENAGERLDITGGRGNKRLLSFDHSKTTAINLTLPLVDLKMLSLISGDSIKEKIKEIFKREVYFVKEDAGETYIELKREPIVNSLYLYIPEGTRDLGDQLKPAESAGTVGEKEYEVDDVNSKKIKLNATSNPAGSRVVVFYHSTTTTPVTTLSINPEKFPQAISFYGEGLWRDQVTEKDVIWDVVGHKGRIRPNYTLSMNATDATVLELVIDMYEAKVDGSECGVYVEYIKGEEVEVDDC